MRVRADAGWLIGFRSVQGLGAAMLMPQTLAMVTMVFPPERRGAAFGIWGAVAGAATIAGPTLGGLLVTAFDWRWIFFVNLPIGIVVLAASFVLIPGLRPGRRHRLDIRGVTLVSLALLAICYALVEGQRYNWGTIGGFVSIPLIAGAGVVLLALFLIDQAVRQRGENEPLMPVRAVPQPELRADERRLQRGADRHARPLSAAHHLPPVRARLFRHEGGLTLMPASLVMVFVAPGLGKLTDRIGGKYILISGLALFAIGMGWLALAVGPRSSWYDLLAPLIVIGIGMGGTFVPLTTTAMGRSGRAWRGRPPGC